MNKILNILKERRGFNFSGYRASMLERRIQKRLLATKCENYDAYLEYLSNYNNELDELIDVFTINVSSFFRDPIVFEHISKFVLPNIISSKQKEKESEIRIWSAGCSCGEEPYSMAILLNELMRKEDDNFNISIFATDIDANALKQARLGIYTANSIANVKHHFFNDYFIEYNKKYKLSNSIINMVKFSMHDMLDQKHQTPPDSIFGGFDIVFCRNLLIYFEPECQNIIFDKLYNSINKNGYLVLGEAETPLEIFKRKLKSESSCCKIYRKTG